MSAGAEEWTVSVRGLRVRIDYHGHHYRTSAPFWPERDREGIVRPNRNAEALACYFRFAVRHYGHPDANDDNPAPLFRPQHEPAPDAKEVRLMRRADRQASQSRRGPRP